MSIRSRLLGIGAGGVMVLGLGLPGLAAGATPDDEAVPVPCWVTETCVGPGPDDGGGGDDEPEDPPEDPGDPEVTVTEDAPRRANPNFTG